jgi:hypothetical protein
MSKENQKRNGKASKETDDVEKSIEDPTLTVIEKDLNPTTRYWLWVQEHFE